MKKIILLGTVVLAMTATSCRKERTCECKTVRTEVRSGSGAQTTVDNSSTKVTIEKQKKKEFKYRQGCFSNAYTYNSDGGNGLSAWSSVTTVETTCELK